MAAPVVAGTVALMLQANPALTPEAVKAILQTTAETQQPDTDQLAQGAGFLNARAPWSSRGPGGLAERALELAPDEDGR